MGTIRGQRIQFSVEIAKKLPGFVIVANRAGDPVQAVNVMNVDESFTEEQDGSRDRRQFK
ncbi:hypothetical protein MYX78_04340 [Acidobacteria bacterium AH-259-G07]|nr:hypothetical protein [Acidobacteria bacterium AH-259-G07]